MGADNETTTPDEATPAAFTGRQGAATPPPTVEAVDHEPPDNSAAYWRRQAEKAQKEATKMKQASMSDADRFREEAAEERKSREAAERKLQDRELHSQFEDVAKKHGALHPSDVRKLADLSSLHVDEDGKMIGSPEKIVKQLKADRPYLFAPQTAGSGGGARTGTAGSGGGSKPTTAGHHSEMDAFIRSHFTR